jgi:hypothetical protein
MRQDTKKILLMLCAVSSKKTLLGLWADLKAVSKAEFESELVKVQEALRRATAGEAATMPTAPEPAQRVRSGTPAARIAHRLTGELGLSERDAVSALTSCLRQKGIDAAKIPDATGRSLTQWVEALLERVSGAVVMGAAQRIDPEH